MILRRKLKYMRHEVLSGGARAFLNRGDFYRVVTLAQDYIQEMEYSVRGQSTNARARLQAKKLPFPV